jgi:hypothetical protein
MTGATSSKENDKLKTELSFHNNAARLIISAAKESGLLESIAKALFFFDKTHCDMPDGTTAREFCGACTLRDDLVRAFNDHTSLASDCVVGLYGGGFADLYGEGFAGVEIIPYLYDPTAYDFKRAFLLAAYGYGGVEGGETST